VDVRFPDGTVIRAIPLSKRQVEDPERDYSLYLDAAWCPTWNPDIVDWEDFGLPNNAGRVMRDVVDSVMRD